MTTQHTSEPWKLVLSDGDNLCVRKATGYGFRRIAIVSRNSIAGYNREDEANANRIVQCVNACAGINNPETIRDLIVSVKIVIEDLNDTCVASQNRLILALAKLGV